MTTKHAILLVPLLLAACGTSNKPEDQIRSMEYDLLNAAQHDQTGDFCRHYKDQDGCLKAVAALHVIGLKLSDVLSGNERSKIKTMRITIHGDRATTSGGKHLVRQRGQWLIADEFNR